MQRRGFSVAGPSAWNELPASIRTAICSNSNCSKKLTKTHLFSTFTLFHTLQHTFGLSGCAISWIRSYLTDRSFFVKIDSSSSPSTTIHTGVPQGSVLGPLLFVLFISPIANVINSDQSNQNNTVSFHQYADDTQLYIVLTRQR